MASVVVPAIDETITLFSWRIVLTKLDLPTLGRPIIAKLTFSFFSVWIYFGSLAIIISNKSPKPIPWLADTKIGSPKPTLK